MPPFGCDPAPPPPPTVVACGGILRRAFNSSLHAGWPPELELSTSDTPLSAGLGGNEPLTKKKGEKISGKALNTFNRTRKPTQITRNFDETKGLIIKIN